MIYSTEINEVLVHTASSNSSAATSKAADGNTRTGTRHSAVAGIIGGSLGAVIVLMTILLVYLVHKLKVLRKEASSPHFDRESAALIKSHKSHSESTDLIEPEPYPLLVTNEFSDAGASREIHQPVMSERNNNTSWDAGKAHTAPGSSITQSSSNSEPLIETAPLSAERGKRRKKNDGSASPRREEQARQIQELQQAIADLKSLMLVASGSSLPMGARATGQHSSESQDIHEQIAALQSEMERLQAKQNADQLPEYVEVLR